MALNAGDPGATSGMALAVYNALNATMVAQGVTPTSAMQTSWRTLSYAVAAGVVAELTGASSASPDFAQSYSSSAQDTTFWPWLLAFVKVFQSWAPTGAATDGQLLKTALTTFLSSNPVPQQLLGSIK